MTLSVTSFCVRIQIRTNPTEKEINKYDANEENAYFDDEFFHDLIRSLRI